jgi:hypothetical protein
MDGFRSCEMIPIDLPPLHRPPAQAGTYWGISAGVVPEEHSQGVPAFAGMTAVNIAVCADITAMTTLACAGMTDFFEDQGI